MWEPERVHSDHWSNIDQFLRIPRLRGFGHQADHSLVMAAKHTTWANAKHERLRNWEHTVKYSNSHPIAGEMWYKVEFFRGEPEHVHTCQGQKFPETRDIRLR